MRLSLEKHALYESAAVEGKPLSTYIRDRLAAQDDVLATRRGLRQSIENLTELVGTPQRHNKDTEQDRAIQIELLLLLRSIASPDKARMAQAEVLRLGLSPWTGERRG
ncbi:mobilization protein [Rudaea sp. 3F27F6]|uniref:mobilization protein n=1 Tax=Rudaea sp. 3F27F6 TaxID=2502208 RepID=UPI001BB0DFC1|nr:mobilization protein [Rudaea sp. 3F27F6]